MNLDVLIFQKNNDVHPCMNLMANSNSAASNITKCPKLDFWPKKEDLIINFNFLGSSLSKNKTSVYTSHDF